MAADEPKTSQTLSVLAHFGFTELTKAAINYDRLLTRLGADSGELLELFGKTANPDQALEYALKLTEQFPAELGVVQKNLASLLLVLGASSALGDFLLREPKALQHLAGNSGNPSSRKEFENFFDTQLDLAGAKSSEELISQLRRIYRTQLLEITVFDLSQEEPTAGLHLVAKALSDLAAVTLDFGLRIARWELSNTTEFGSYAEKSVMDTKLAVIGMGKCGAGELNYISDVDVIFVAENKETDSGLDIETKLATRLMRVMDQANPEPALWQVDANLRPEGRSGALVRTLESHLSYYQRWASNWEFQALLKATPIAGDLELGGRYSANIKPMVWESSRRENFVESVQKMRERVTENIDPTELERQIKLGVGGLRDVEFTVQLLQLVHGRTDETVRSPSTLKAIEELSAAGYIGRAEAADFARHYRFLRVLEHRIQLSKLRRTHLMPVLESEQRAIARSIDPNWSAEHLHTYWQQVKQEVRSLHQRIFYRPLLVAVSKSEGGLELSSDQVHDRLSAIGFIDTAGAIRNIEALTAGLSRRAQIQKQLLPVLLEWFGQGIDPDGVLLAFRRLSENLGESPWFLRMLRDSSGAAERLAQALSGSKLATAMLEINPEAASWFESPEKLKLPAMDSLVVESQALLSRHSNLDEFGKAIRAIRRRETLRIALAEVVAGSEFRETTKAISVISEWYLSALAQGALKFIMQGDIPAGEMIDLGLVAMGRFGGAELVFGSDADLMVVYQPIGDTSNEQAQSVSEQVVSQIRLQAKDQLLEFDIDLGLRPEGKNGPVARSLDSYASYYARWGDIWENQALLRARVFFGSELLKTKFSVLADKYRYPEELTLAEIVEIRRIKARVENERLPFGADPTRHLKLGRGSLTDIEWLIQLLQLKNGSQHPSIRTAETLEALNQLVVAGLIASHDARVLEESWLLTSKIRSAIYLWSGKRSDLLPNDRKQLEAIARLLHYPHGSATQLEEDYLGCTRRARTVFERVFFA